MEASIILNQLNADQTIGSFQLDETSGYVYYRQSSIVDGLELTDEQFAQLMRNIEQVAIQTSEIYSDVISGDLI